jgi:DNA damage-binding protein 1
VRLVSASSGELLSEWRDPTPTRLSITVATANATQVLLAIEGSHLVYLEIGDRSLREVKRLAIEFDVSCLNINPIGENRNQNELAAVGTWKDYGIMLYSLPDLNFIKSFHFAGNVLPRSVLF